MFNSPLSLMSRRIKIYCCDERVAYSRPCVYIVLSAKIAKGYRNTTLIGRSYLAPFTLGSSSNENLFKQKKKTVTNTAGVVSVEDATEWNFT